MDKNIKDKAKDLFLKYGGSHFHMERDGCYDRYLEFGVSKDQEEAWLKDYELLLLEKALENDVVNEDFMKFPGMSQKH